MSYLSEELKRQMQAAKLSGSQIAERSKISASQVYKWANDDQTSIDAKQLDALAAALSHDPVDHAKLLVAHLQDECFGTAKGYVTIDLRSEGELKDKPRTMTKGERAIHFLAAERVKDRSVNDLIIDLAKVLGADI